MQFIKDKLITPLSQLTMVEALWMVSVGVLGGVFPVPALTTGATLVLCTLCRIPLAQTSLAGTINLILTPIQFVLIIPFAQAGRVLCLPLVEVLLWAADLAVGGSISNSCLGGGDASERSAPVGRGLREVVRGEAASSSPPGPSSTLTTTGCYIVSVLTRSKEYMATAEFSLDGITASMDSPMKLLETSGGILLVGTIAWGVLCVVVLGVVLPLISAVAKGGRRQGGERLNSHTKAG